jgi:hypothetical protein
MDVNGEETTLKWLRTETNGWGGALVFIEMSFGPASNAGKF